MEGDGAAHTDDDPPLEACRSGAGRGRIGIGRGTLAPTAASAAPADAAAAGEQVERAGAQLAEIDEQVNQARITVAEQQRAAEVAAQQASIARAAVDAYDPQLRAIAQSRYTSDHGSRVAAFLTSGSAAELVQQLTTLDMI